MDPQTPRCDWCQQKITAAKPAVLVSERFYFHEGDCLAFYKRHTLSLKLRDLPHQPASNF